MLMLMSLGIVVILILFIFFNYFYFKKYVYKKICLLVVFENEIELMVNIG